MESSLLPWQWVIESLASIPDAGTSIFSAIVDKFPFVLGDSSNDVRERLALRYLEECAGMSGGETPPAVATNNIATWASAAKIDASRTCEEVLRSKVVTSNDHGKENAGFYERDLQQFILLKRAVLKKPSIELLKEKVLGSNCPDVSYSKECNNLPKVPRSFVNHLPSKSTQTMKPASPWRKKLTLIRKYRELKNLANTPLKFVGGGSQKNSSSPQHLAEQNASDEKLNQQTNVDSTCSEYQMEKTKANPGEGSAEFHDVEMQSPKGNVSGRTSAPTFTPDNFKESRSGHNVLHPDRPELEEVVDSDCDDAQLLEQCSIPQPSSAQSLCIKCGSSGQLLNCCGEGCSRAIHESCLGLLAGVEETDIFYCPFCSYRNARMMFEKSKRKAQEARRNLFSFYDIGPAVPAPKMESSAKNTIESEQVSVKHNTSEHPDFPSNQQFLNKSVYEKHGDIQNGKTSHFRFTGENYQKITQNEQNQPDIAGDTIQKNILPCKETMECCTYQEVQETPIKLNSETGREHESTRATEDQQPVNDLGITGHDSLSSELNTSHDRNDDFCVNNGTREVSRDSAQVEEIKNLHTFDADTEHISLQPNKRSVLNVEGGRDHSAKRKALSSKIRVRFPKRNRRDKTAKAGNYDGNIENNKTDGSSSRELRKRQHRQNRCYSMKRLSGRRPKLIWKQEEEEVLEEAMQKIPHNIDGSIPWIKILEYCRPILHESRTPIDLKDKWRNMQKKEAKNRG